MSRMTTPMVSADTKRMVTQGHRDRVARRLGRGTTGRGRTPRRRAWPARPRGPAPRSDPGPEPSAAQLGTGREDDAGDRQARCRRTAATEGRSPPTSPISTGTITPEAAIGATTPIVPDGQRGVERSQGQRVRRHRRPRPRAGSRAGRPRRRARAPTPQQRGTPAPGTRRPRRRGAAAGSSGHRRSPRTPTGRSTSARGGRSPAGA